MTGSELKRIRREVLGMTQVQLGETIHRTAVRISQWENDRDAIPPLIADHIAMLATAHKARGGRRRRAA